MLAPECWRMIDLTIQPTDSLSISRKSLLAMIVVFGSVYGATMGSYGWIVGGRSFVAGIPQMIFSGIKVPMLLLVTFGLSVPSFFVVNSLLGLRDDFTTVIRNILVCQATISIVLCSLAPLVWLWYFSVPHTKASYSTSILLNTAFFAVASIASQARLRRLYSPLVRRDRSHGWMVWAWLIVYAAVGIQMGWVLRPFIGNPGQTPAFFRPEAWDNAYIKLWQIIRGIV